MQKGFATLEIIFAVLIISLLLTAAVPNAAVRLRHSFSQVTDMQKGFATLEIIFAVLIISLLLTAAVPNAAHIFDRVSLDYETKRLYSDLRFLQAVSRSGTFEFTGTNNNVLQQESAPVMQINDTARSYQILRGNNNTLVREEHFMRGVKSINFTRSFPFNKIHFNTEGQAQNTNNKALSTTIELTSRLGKQSKIVFTSVGRIRGGRDDE